MVSLKYFQKKERMMRFQKSHMQIHEAYQFLHKKRTAQVTADNVMGKKTSISASL